MEEKASVLGRLGGGFGRLGGGDFGAGEREVERWGGGGERAREVSGEVSW